MLPFRHYYLTVAIISNVQNVRLQRRHKPTDDASIRRWRGSQQTGPVRTTRRSALAQLLDVLDYAVVHTLHTLFCTLFSGFGSAKIIEICLRFDRVCSQMYTCLLYTSDAADE